MIAAIKKNFLENIRKPQTILSLAVLLIFVVGSIILYARYGSELLLFIKDTNRLKEWLDGFGALGRLVFVGIRALQTVVKVIPAEPLEIGAGFAYGTFGGCLLCMLGTGLGSIVILALTKLFGEKLINLFISKEQLAEFAFLNNPKKIGGLLWVIYLIPGTPKDLITYFACMLPISLPRFFLITSIARIPAILSSTWCGSALVEKNYAMSAIIFGVTFVLSLLGVLVYRKISQRSTKLDDEKVA